MSIAQAERLKSELTDKYVVVAEGVPELRRFVGLTGTVKTVNMSCRALVQFDGPVDISWYDIDPAYLMVVDAPLPKKSEAKPEAKAAEARKNPQPRNPLARARWMPSAPPEPPKAAAPAAAPAAAKPSPLDMIRKQVAGGAAPAAAAAGARRCSSRCQGISAGCHPSADGGQVRGRTGSCCGSARSAAVAAPPAAPTPAPAPEAAAPVVPAAPAPPQLVVRSRLRTF